MKPIQVNFKSYEGKPTSTTTKDIKHKIIEDERQIWEIERQCEGE